MGLRGYQSDLAGCIGVIGKNSQTSARIFLSNCLGMSSPPIPARLRYNPLILLIRVVWKRVARGIAVPDGGKDSQLFASGCGPVRFGLDHSLFSGHELGHESKAADRSVRSTQTRHRIAQSNA